MEWSNGNPVVISKICNKLFKCALYVISIYTSNSSFMLTYYCSHNAGAAALKTPSHVSTNAKVCAQQELEGQTGDIDSKAEESDSDS